VQQAARKPTARPLFCVVKNRTWKRAGVLGRSEALKGSVSGKTEIAVLLTNSRPEPDTEPASRGRAMNQSSEEHSASAASTAASFSAGVRPFSAIEKRSSL